VIATHLTGADSWVPPGAGWQALLAILLLLALASATLQGAASTVAGRTLGTCVALGSVCLPIASPDDFYPYLDTDSPNSGPASREQVLEASFSISEHEALRVFVPADRSFFAQLLAVEGERTRAGVSCNFSSEGPLAKRPQLESYAGWLYELALCPLDTEGTDRLTVRLSFFVTEIREARSDHLRLTMRGNALGLEAIDRGLRPPSPDPDSEQPAALLSREGTIQLATLSDASVSSRLRADLLFKPRFWSGSATRFALQTVRKAEIAHHLWLLQYYPPARESSPDLLLRSTPLLFEPHRPISQSVTLRPSLASQRSYAPQ
ncbi:MAG: hypothetical protein AAGA81_24005, partial [Acidobacteriota bacterium]